MRSQNYIAGMMEDYAKTATLLNVKPGAVIAGRYEVECRIGSGGMGMVFRVVDRDLNNQIVALKLLHPHLAEDEQVFRRFRNEVLVARSLSHPHIVRIHDIGRAEGGFSYISMEYVDGLSLRDYINAKTSQNNGDSSLQKTLPFDESLKIFGQILAGVAYAHDKGVIHRDLKPANVMISNNHEAKLADFGTARIAGMDTHLTQTGQSIGTPDYMSPEQIQGQQLDARCDVYALGIVAYELVSGDRPFVADSAVAVAFKHLNEPLPELTGDAARVPDWYKTLIKKATAKDRNDRYTNAGEMIVSLAEHVPELSVQTGRYSVDRTHVMSSSHSSIVNPQYSGETRQQGFELGNSDTEGNSGVWQVGDIDSLDFKRDRNLDDSRIRRAVEVDDEPSKLMNYLWASLVFMVACLVLVPRFSDGTRDWMEEEVGSWQQSSGADLSWLGAIAGLSLDEKVIEAPAWETAALAPETQPGAKKPEASPAAPVKKQPEKEAASAKAEIEKPIPKADSVKSEPESEQVVKQAQAKVPVPAFIEPNKVPSEIVPDDEAIPVDESVDAAPEQTEIDALATAKLADEAAKLQTPASVTPAVVTATLSVRSSEGTEITSPVNVNELKRITWSANVSGISGGSADAEKRSAKEFTLNVIDTRKFNLISKLSPTSLKFKAENEAALDGGFQNVGSRPFDAGAYRLDLVRNGEVLASKEISFYRVSAKIPEPAIKTGEKITIVRGPDGSVPLPPRTNENFPGTVAPNLPPSIGTPSGELAVLPGAAQSEPGIQPALPRAEGTAPLGTANTGMGYPSQAVSNTNSNTGLPAARQPAGAQPSNAQLPAGYNRSSLDLSKEQFRAGAVMPQQVPVAVGNSEHYTGTIFVAPPGSASPEQKPMILDLTVQGSSITGRARIDGLGEFNVNGQIHPRGLELELNGSSGEQLRLTGSRRDNSLRGSYLMRGDTRNGRWQATLIR